MFAILASFYKTIIFAHTLYTLQGSVRDENDVEKTKNKKIILF